jgi:4-hydroxy-3-methylbut-2-enyl diphosphate reductase
MRVVRSSVSGYCMGVRRAVEIAEKALLENEHKAPDFHVYTLGYLIHNKTALESLALRGLSVLKPEEISGCTKHDTVIIRAHGVSPSVRKALEKTGAKIIDATCPRVLSNQKKASDNSKKNTTVILAGDKNHGEVIAISGSAVNSGNKCFVIQNESEAKEFVQKYKTDKKNYGNDNFVLLCQTTIAQIEYDKITTVLLNAIPDIKVFDTICPATSERQLALKELCKEVDGVVVIGGKNSANSQRLYNSAKLFSKLDEYKAKEIIFVETEKEIPESFKKLDSVGITSGASTPDYIIEKVEKYLLGNK